MTNPAKNKRNPGYPSRRCLKTKCTSEQNIQLDDDTRQEIDRKVRRVAYSIIEGKGATYYGIGSALARIAAAILDDQRAVLAVCSPRSQVVGVSDVTLALPHIVGAEGIQGTLSLPLNEAEEAALRTSAKIIRAAIDEIEGSV